MKGTYAMVKQNIVNKNPKSYVRVKSRSLHRLSLFDAQDEKNGTVTTSKMSLICKEPRISSLL